MEKFTWGKQLNGKNMQMEFLFIKYNVQGWPRGPSLVIYILDKSELTTGKLGEKP